MNRLPYRLSQFLQRPKRAKGRKRLKAERIEESMTVSEISTLNTSSDDDDERPRGPWLLVDRSNAASSASLSSCSSSSTVDSFWSVDTRMRAATRLADLDETISDCSLDSADRTNSTTTSEDLGCFNTKEVLEVHEFELRRDSNSADGNYGFVLNDPHFDLGAVVGKLIERKDGAEIPLRVGDRILSINGRNVIEEDRMEIVHLFRCTGRSCRVQIGRMVRRLPSVDPAEHFINERLGNMVTVELDKMGAARANAVRQEILKLLGGQMASLNSAA
ncbi:hypothetical protein M3Y99_01948600 [Aphelenchoides fujianensis]|nr:hypothetical protein M3Y99_01948600 [Aphelenchoides fujianensis]